MLPAWPCPWVLGIEKAWNQFLAWIPGVPRPTYLTSIPRRTKYDICLLILDRLPRQNGDLMELLGFKDSNKCYLLICLFLVVYFVCLCFGFDNYLSVFACKYKHFSEIITFAENLKLWSDWKSVPTASSRCRMQWTAAPSAWSCANA